MPLNAKGRKILKALQARHGPQKGKSIFYATVQTGKLHGVEERKRR